MDELVVQGEINSKILTLRGKQVMLDRDLAELYCVIPRRLREQVKRNIKRFPEDFMFQLSENEIEAFTEQGIYMLATVLKSDVAIDVNIAIMRTFTKLREFSKHYNALAKQLIEIDRKYEKRQIEVNCFTSIALEPQRSEQSVAV